MELTPKQIMAIMSLEPYQIKNLLKLGIDIMIEVSDKIIELNNKKLLIKNDKEKLCVTINNLKDETPQKLQDELELYEKDIADIDQLLIGVANEYGDFV